MQSCCRPLEEIRQHVIFPFSAAVASCYGQKGNSELPVSGPKHPFSLRKLPFPAFFYAIRLGPRLCKRRGPSKGRLAKVFHLVKDCCNQSLAVRRPGGIRRGLSGRSLMLGGLEKWDEAGGGSALREHWVTVRPTRE